MELEASAPQFQACVELGQEFSSVPQFLRPKKENDAPHRVLVKGFPGG